MAMANKLMDSWKDTYTVRRVFGDAVEKNSITVIPVATVAGGGGGGSGSGGTAGEGEGSGFGGMARPAGVFVVKADTVEWHPALDITMLGMAGIALSALIALVVGGAIRRRQR